MRDQISIIATFLAALLTGGFLMIFIESQQVANNMTERFHFIMRPFSHSFTNYVRFISFFKNCFIFKVEKKEGYMKSLKEHLEEISKLGAQSITSGQDYPTSYFTAKQLRLICNAINDIWYCIDNDYDGFQEVIFDTHHSQIDRERTINYLREISPKYKGLELTKDLLGNVSGDFYVDIYQPIEYVLPRYERWLKKEKEFKMLAIITITITLLSMLLLLLFRCYIPIWILTLLCVFCCGLLLFELYKLIQLVEFSKKSIQ
ncbi:MAG: hypothetical protein ACFN4F_04805 [Porphyromonas endodontalis]|uniref:hypothetical protein n=1 Tax=Porphyromonas endodontalis TaxID=28124 RepID=UPI00361F9C94